MFTSNRIITDYDTAKNIQLILINLFKSDPHCKNLNRVYYGGKSIVYEDYNSVLDVDVLLKKYENYIIEDGEKTVQDNRCNINTNYLVQKTQTPTKDSINYNIQAIKGRNIDYLHTVLSIDGEVELQNEQDFYDYIRTEINLAELLGIKYANNFKCIVHNDNNPSAGIFKANDGAYMYNCFGCGFKGNIIHIIQMLTRLKTYQVLDLIKEIYNIEIVKTDWQKEQVRILKTNREMLLNGDLQNHYPEVYKLVRRYIPQLVVMHDIAIMNVRDENFTDNNGDIVFFISNNELAKLLDQRQPTRMNQRNVLFAFLKLLKRLDKNEIPPEDLEKALQIQKKYNHHKLVNYFSLGDYDVFKMKKAQERVEMWNKNSMSMGGLSYEGIYRTFGYEVASEVYPQHKTKFMKIDNKYEEVDRTTTEASNDRTIEIVEVMMSEIRRKEYATENEVIDALRSKYGKGFIHKQIKRSLQEILDGYGLKRVRANKELKDKYSVVSKGYPFIIIEDN